MAVTAPNLTITVTTNDSCDELILEDVTGAYNALTNALGYGLPGGPDEADVTGVEIVMSYATLGTTLTYDFTVAAGVITAATLAIGSGTPASILSSLPSTAWPFDSTNPFNLIGDYGITIPEFEDDVFTTTYTITGEIAGPEPFDFETTVYTPVTCNSRCCVNKKWVAIDPNCGCSNEAYKTAMYGESLLMQVEIAAEEGSLDTALAALEQLRLLCDQEDCGC